MVFAFIGRRCPSEFVSHGAQTSGVCFLPFLQNIGVFSFSLFKNEKILDYFRVFLSKNKKV
uniref:Uncharacterized protein n=1 Tax=Anguilla anguilla TaxID=7936 RepID=A0A0E9Q5U4_ANGAN